TVTGALNYTWSPSKGLSCTNCANPVTRPDSSIKYFVKGTTAFGCSSRDSVTLSVQFPFAMKVGVGDTLCKGRSAQLFAEGANTYAWTPAAGLSNSKIAQPIATPAATTNYMVIGMDGNGCFKDTGYVPIKVFPLPSVHAGDDKSISVGQSIDLFPTISPDVTGVNWSPTSGIFRNAYPGITVKPSVSTEYTVEVSNAGGCIARDKVSIYVTCNNSNIFVPNTFSPNGDGTNDIFYPRGSGIFKIKLFRIFNRWGEVIFEKANINANEASQGWDGTFKGQKLPPDVFVYTMDVVCENNTLLIFKGNVALIQ
nr:gliding motility-associated C-terminal domain-containing protein [Chitinophagaceae bacterium]